MTDLLVQFALQAAFVVGVTAVIGKAIPEKARDVVLPLVALILGVVAMTWHLWLPDGLPELIAQGVALGGTATGLYVVKKENDKAKVEAATASAPEVKVETK